MENIYHPSTDPNRANEISQLRKVLNEYLRFRNDTIADSVYSFFEPYHLEGLQVFANVAAKSLKIFATEKKIRNSFRYKSDDDYFILCALLNNVIIFCNDIAGREANIVRIEKSKWEISDTSYIPLETIVYEKKKYENKLTHLKEIMLNSKK